MLGFSSSTNVEFLPDEDARAWVADRLSEVSAHLTSHWGEVASRPRVVTQTSIPQPKDLDDLFDLLCGVQREIGQEDLEFQLVELATGGGPSVPRGFEPIGNPEGHLLHTFQREGEYVLLAVPQLFKVTQIAFGSVARELGRIAIAEADRAGTALRKPPQDADDLADLEADAELAGMTLGLGPWVANGAYIYESACCGGGCGIDLTSLQAGLSMPEACFALAVDGQRKGLSRRVIARHLDANQTAALKRSWSFVKKQPALTAPPAQTQLSAG